MRRYDLVWGGDTFVLLIDAAQAPPGFERVSVAESRRLAAQWLGDRDTQNPGLHATHRASGPEPFPPGSAFLKVVLRTLVDGSAGAALFRRAPPVHSDPTATDLSDLATEPPPAKESAKTWFELVVVDEVGEAIADLDMIVSFDGGQETKKTDGSGKIRIEDAELSHASARVADVNALREIVEPRWEEARDGDAPPVAADVTHALLSEDVGGISVAKEVPHTLVIKPRLGKIFMELFDKTGRTRHAARSYEISGAADFEGTTDDQGRLEHKDVPFGDYELKITLEGDDFSDEYTTAAIVLDPGDEQPQVRMIGALPRLVFVRIRGMVFETNKNFVLPLAVPALQRIRDVYEENDPGELLVVGHTDTVGDPSVNDPLSVERSESVAAYLTDNVDPWLEMYDDSSKAKRWGEAEDLAMIGAVTVLDDKPAEINPIKWFQLQHNENVKVEASSRPELDPDGVSGPKTRRELITDYMLLDGTSLAEDDDNAEEFDIEITEHGCGENFPLDETGEELDQAAVDNHEDAQDRRVELFFFDREFGIVPPPPGKNSGPGSTEYPAWRQRADENNDLWVGPHVLQGRMTYVDGSPAALVAFVVKAGDKAIDGGYTDEDGRYRLTVFSDQAEVALVDGLAVGKTPQDEGGDKVAVTGVPDTGGVAVA